MTESEQLVLPKEVAQMVDEEAARLGVSRAEVIKRRLTATGPAMRTWAPPMTQQLPPRDSPGTFQEAVARSIEARTQLALVRGMEGLDTGGAQHAPPLTAEAIAAAVSRALDERDRPRRRRDEDGDDDDPFRAIEKTLARKAQLKMLAELSKDDPQAQNYIAQQVGELNKRIDAANERAAQAERQSFSDKVAAAETRTNAIEQALNEKAMALEERIAQLQQYGQHGQEPPKDAVSQIKDMVLTVEGLKSALGTGGGKPDTWDRVERVLDKATDLGGRMLEGVASVEAGKRGVPPHATFQGGPGGPVYLPEDGGVPPTPAEDVVVVNGQRIPVASLPENPPGGYTLTDGPTGQTRKVTREEFVRAVKAEMAATGQANVSNTSEPSPPAPSTPGAAPTATPRPPHRHAPATPSPSTTPRGRRFNPVTRMYEGDTPEHPVPPQQPSAPPPAVEPPATEPPETGPAEVPPIADGDGPIVVDGDGHIVGSSGLASNSSTQDVE